MTIKENIEGNGDFPVDPSTLENVDTAMFKWLDEKMDLYTTTNRGWKKTPVIWSGAERSFQIKNDRDLRDKNGSFILPVITIKRTSITKDMKKKGRYWANLPGNKDEKGGSIIIAQEIQQDKTANFANVRAKRRVNQDTFKQDNKKIVYKIKSIPLPIYVAMTYVIEIRTEYQQQMNDLIQPFITYPDGVNYFIISNEGHRYEAFVKSDYNIENNADNLSSESRMFKTSLTIEVLGHLVGKGANQDKPNVVIRENIVEIKINRERTWTEEEIRDKKIF